MPRIAKGAKYVFGWSIVSPRGVIRVPPEAWAEYGLQGERRVYLMSGSVTSGGFGVMPPRLLADSVIGRALFESEAGFKSFEVPESEPRPFKGRLCCWVSTDGRGSFGLKSEAMEAYGVGPGSELLVIRSSDIAFGMAARGPLIGAARGYAGIIERFDAIGG
jgi:hypothetical protein